MPRHLPIESDSQRGQGEAWAHIFLGAHQVIQTWIQSWESVLEVSWAPGWLSWLSVQWLSSWSQDLGGMEPHVGLCTECETSPSLCPSALLMLALLLFLLKKKKEKKLMEVAVGGGQEGGEYFLSHIIWARRFPVLLPCLWLLLSLCSVASEAHWFLPNVI